MESKKELKEIDLKNRTCHYFDDIIRDLNIDFDNISLEEKSYKNKYEMILSYDISYKTLIGPDQLSVKSDKINGFIKIYAGIRYLVLYDYERYNAIDERIKNLVSEKSGITDIINYNFARIR